MPPRHYWRLPSVDLFSRGPLSNAGEDFAQLRAQWTNPTDVLTILTNALAQLCSSHPRYFTPVALSFGWVAYAFSAILSAIGSRRLTPDPEIACTLIDVGSNYSRDVHSWVLSRLVRDYELPAGISRGLTVSFYRTLRNKAMGVPDRDWVYWSGVIVIVLQLGIATIPGVLNGDWVIFILTFGGIVLIQLQASLPQWRKELWAGRKIKEKKHAVVCLTRGNGSLYAMVIRSDGCGISMADMASGWEVKDRTTIPGTLILAILWLIHLFCTSGLQNDSWYSLLIGAIGMLQNALASGARRSPGALGIHLEEKVKHIHKEKVFEALVEAEKEEENVGILLTDVYFPGGLRPEEETWKKRKIAESAGGAGILDNEGVSSNPISEQN
ncbi:hypothetical protein DFH08DRAFT_1046745 [Mycena albidolilacea]|uniref:Uncharacterized protein n=1 Tax=Mycena albidolilacea TaxID=1033008 RepID=A0AAD6Z762_9AGAR|nr:hypothetical protein DFH08DRAFT_1046745 [Mycena albidolilacea]